MKATPLKNNPKKGCTVFTVRGTAAHCRLRFLLVLRVYKFKPCKDRNGKHGSSCPKGLFLSLSCNTVTTSIFCCFSSMPVEKILGQSLPFCYTCQLLMEILIASIKYFSNSVSFSLNWRLRTSCKSKGGAVIQNRWTPNRR